MIVGDAANFLLGGIPGDLHDMYVVDVEPLDLMKASHTLQNISTSVHDVHVKLSGSVASLEGRWEGSGAATFDSEIWQPLSHGLGTLERECATASGKLADLAIQAEAAYAEKVAELNQEIQTQLDIFAGMSLIGAPELGALISDAVGGLAARLGGELVGRIVSGIVDAITAAIQKVLAAFGKLLTLGARSVASLIPDLGGIVDAIATQLLGDGPSAAASRIAGIPRNVIDVLNRVDTTGAAASGFKGGRTFLNDGRAGSKVLPRVDDAGSPITYREWDVNPYQPRVDRGVERLVTGSDGSAWYTDDHYDTFMRVR